MEEINLRDLDGPIDVETFCRGLQTAGENHLKGYFHYTTWPCLVGMETPIKLPDGRMRRVLLLKSPQDKNDLTEGEVDKRFWYASFAYGPHEKIHMWEMYGKKSPEAVRLRIGFDEMKAWYDQSTHAVYGVDANGEYSDVSDCLEWIRLVDIGYVSKDLPQYVEKACVKHRHREYEVVPFCHIQDRAEGRLGDYAAYFKEDGWVYEQEVRLLLKFREPLKCEKLAVDFDVPLKSVVESPQLNLVSGPWRCGQTDAGATLRDVPLSDYCKKISL